DQHVDRALGRGELAFELGDAIVVLHRRRRRVAHLRGTPPIASPVNVWLTSSMPDCSPKLWNPTVGYAAYASASSLSSPRAAASQCRPMHENASNAATLPPTRSAAMPRSRRVWPIKSPGFITRST